MKYQAILFDMDGTLVPMDLQTFLNGYLKLLLKKLEKHNINPDTFEQN
ncbi:MAG: HAD family hydrolase, partial [Erysipelotrichaceae bacterium]|nr:HAD family hydrolase [Erysipelotrichaceae bacterium]